eukprot:scaffold275264_cov39-Tisochrysis_lutea.AAC.2
MAQALANDRRICVESLAALFGLMGVCVPHRRFSCNQWRAQRDGTLAMLTVFAGDRQLLRRE